MKKVRIMPTGAKRKSGKHVSHRMHQAQKCRAMATRLDSQIVKLVKERRRLIDLAEKLEAQDESGFKVTTEEIVRYGMRD